MIATKKKDFDEILKTIENYKQIFLVGCGECATTCHTGGEKEVLEFKGYLEAKGKEVSGWAVPDAPCVAAQLKAAFAKNINSLKTSDVILVLACGLGVQSVKENSRFVNNVVPVLNSIGAVMVDGEGNFFEVCSNCGECILDKTGCICPVTRCPKGLLNGPCGGMIKGKCEVDRERDCAWVLIYKELEKKKRLDNFKALQGPKDYSKATRPHKITLG